MMLTNLVVKVVQICHEFIILYEGIQMQLGTSSVIQRDILRTVSTKRSYPVNHIYHSL